MSITNETAQKYAGKPAVSCCRFEAGTLIEASILEDPAIFPDLEDSGLLEISGDTLKIGDVLGGKLKETIDALTPLTLDLVEDLPEKEEGAESEDEPGNVEESSVVETKQPTLDMSVSGYVTIRIEEGKNIELTFPVA